MLIMLYYNKLLHYLLYYVVCYVLCYISYHNTNIILAYKSTSNILWFRQDTLFPHGSQHSSHAPKWKNLGVLGRAILLATQQAPPLPIHFSL